ncbi:hypothetical protein [Streptomyces europaeiscabiei]|uniref:hypothetical protein n=1 Tax=Streptomyces europaeiscabiei TaxID=146819 RepID=UPI0038F6FF18
MGHSEVDGSGAGGEFVELCEFVFGAGEAGCEAVDFAEPALLFGFVDVGEDVVASNARYLWISPGWNAEGEVPPANWTAGVYAAGTRLCLSKDLVSSGVTYP